MRLWHEKLIPFLPNAQLLGQHRECAALRGLGWGRKHSTVDYVFTHSPAMLYFYHSLVMHEMTVRGFKVDRKWIEATYRGLRSESWSESELWKNDIDDCDSEFIYPEHNEKYLRECLDNLRGKGVTLNI